MLGDPRDPRNPYGRRALWAAEPDALPAPPAGLPGPAEVPGADRLARALRPLFRRDLALAHAWSIRPLSHAAVPHPAAALLGPAALLAAAGGVLHSTARIVDGLSRHQAAARQWRPVLATVFADLLACESLTAAALRTCPEPAQHPHPDPNPDPGPDTDPDRELLAAVAGYLVPRLAVELLGDLELVLNECGFEDDSLERRTLARIVRHRFLAGAGRAATDAAQARIVRGLNAAGTEGQDEGAQHAAPLSGTGTAEASGTGTVEAAGTGTVEAAGTGTVEASGTGITEAAGTGIAEAAGTGIGEAAGAAALARLGRRLRTEQRALRAACAATAVHDLADPAARALADRQALLVLAARTLDARETAAGAHRSFLGGAGWALLALGRITVRLGLPLPAPLPDAQPIVWEELARRAAHGVDCDLYARRPA
ncbi:hypothetical protein AB0D33_13920 [Streptomyces sp. NPDC048404]|uniref:hypothetical protein n=1 Tax=unclassified Streptomyces TaxID=2593676 RepID=UPI00341591C2